MLAGFMSHVLFHGELSVWYHTQKSNSRDGDFTRRQLVSAERSSFLFINYYYKLNFIFYADTLINTLYTSQNLAESILHNRVFPSRKMTAGRKEWRQESKEDLFLSLAVKPAYHSFWTEASRYAAMADAFQVVVLASLGTLQPFSSWVVCRTDKSFHRGSACQAPFYFKTINLQHL